jgi:hypothetical protein
VSFDKQSKIKRLETNKMFTKWSESERERERERERMKYEIDLGRRR